MQETLIQPSLADILESLLFATDTPLTLKHLRDITEKGDDEILPALEQLEKTYNFRQDAFYLAKIAEGYQLRTRSKYGYWIGRLNRANRPILTKASLETLSIIAYKQPVVRAEVEYLRGVDSGGVLKHLLELKFIRVLGRREIPGRPIVYATTHKFLEYFGLASLKDLPPLPEAGETSPSPSPLLESREIPFSED